MPTQTTHYSLNKPLVADAVDENLWGGYLNDDFDIIDTTMYANSLAGFPLGAGCDYWGTVAPTGYLFAYGQAINRTTYADLFVIYGTTFGVGDGSITFNIPDKRGRSSFGKDDMGGSSANRLTGLTDGIDGDVLGGTGGLESTTLTTAQIPAHTHGITGTTQLNNIGTTSVKIQNPEGASATVASDSTGGGTAHNNVPPGIVCNYIIRAL